MVRYSEGSLTPPPQKKKKVSLLISNKEGFINPNMKLGVLKLKPEDVSACIAMSAVLEITNPLSFSD